MGKYKKRNQNILAIELSEKIEKIFKHFHIKIAIDKWDFVEDRIIYTVKLKGNSRAKSVLAHIPDVQNRLKLPLFQAVQDDFDLYFIVSEQDIEYPRLTELLESAACNKALQKINLPYIVGHDAMGMSIILDIVDLPHLLLGGSTNSGKTVGLQAIIATIAYIKPVSEVNLVLVDVGTDDLSVFDGIPHLACPIVRDRDTAYRTLVAVKAEMERRITLEHASPDEYEQLPRLVLVVDEFPALFTGQCDKKMTQAMVTAISSLLQRGRHAKIHLVLAAQNPTYQNMKVDLGNITARIAFKCAKRNYSETILGEGGAENLSGPGNLLLKLPDTNGLQWIQGIYIKPKELRQLVEDLRTKSQAPVSNKFEITILADSLMESSDTPESRLTCSVVRKSVSREDQMFADAIVWALEQDTISVNALMKHYRLGWNKASKLVERLEELGIVGRPEGKVPREVIPAYPEDLPDELIGYLQEAGHSQDSIIEAFCSRTKCPANGQ